MDELAALPEAFRKLAFDRFRPLGSIADKRNPVETTAILE
jgi:hypothetical protein